LKHNRLKPEYTQTYTQVAFLLQLGSLDIRQIHSIMLPGNSFPLLLSDSVRSHWLGDATPKPSLADRAQDLHLSMLQHPDNFSEWRSDLRVWIPAPGHDLTKGGQAIMRYGRSDTLVHHGKSGLYCCHVSEWEHASYELPQHNAKAVDIDFLVIWPVLNHLSTR
jgi:hypothetical protein